MRSLALLITFALILASAPMLTGCGGVTAFGFKSNMQAVSGTVSSVQVSVSNNGSFITFVTLQSNGFPNQFAFCGDHAAQFPMNTSVTVDFNPGQDCNVITVVVTG
ncbi:MAG TPA: hypothetical protein VMS96_09400 [Terriglobales bacterium]|nr:hypothetical protein [Terriglobales bacterium]